MCAEMHQPTTLWVHAGPPECAQPVWQGCALTPGITPFVSRDLLDLVMIIQSDGGYTTAEGWTGISS